MSRARIYKPAKNAMQSGKGNTKAWLLEYVSTDRTVDSIIGWTSSSDMYPSEVKLHFSTKEEAISYAHNNDIQYDLIEPNPAQKLKLRAYTSVYKK